MHLPKSLTLFHCSGIITWIFVAGIFSTISDEGGHCENFKMFVTVPLSVLKICMMQTTTITSANFQITSEEDEMVDGFISTNNLKLSHLPANLGEKFPNLLLLDAAGCSIKYLAKESFKDLGKLLHLGLKGNRIEQINSETFENIPQIETIILCKYAI